MTSPLAAPLPWHRSGKDRIMSARLDYASASPVGLKILGQLHDYVARSGLDPLLVDLVYLRISQINGCAYCIDIHSRDLIRRKMGISKLVLVPVWRESGDLFDATERAALAWAETVTRVSEAGVPDEDYAAASAIFDDKALTDLTIAIGLMNSFNRLAISFRAVPAAAS
jgi:AhpD family alkylhydroperoxidase